jgi:hypothetical protein
VADVLGDPAVLRVDVRADEADLHDTPRSPTSGVSKRGGRSRPPG